ncbi:MAG: polymer-forming cytoskeletal protein [Bacteroidetes bacterium]|nr:polymer-forming cytoskeletal protein [Bacteroidota bacterium]
MFSTNGKEGQARTSKNGTSNASSVNLIGIGTEIQGDITCEGDIRVDGSINGTINSKAKIVLGSTGSIKGDLMCKNADISGKIDGTVHVDELLFLKGTAMIDGDITTDKLIVEAGAKFNGSCHMGAKEIKYEEKSAEPAKEATA